MIICSTNNEGREQVFQCQTIEQAAEWFRSTFAGGYIGDVPTAYDTVLKVHYYMGEDGAFTLDDDAVAQSQLPHVAENPDISVKSYKRDVLLGICRNCDKPMKDCDCGNYDPWGAQHES